MGGDLRDQLQRTLGDAYSLGRELSGGGMSRVFLATETRLRRPVVVKLLSPDLAAGVSASRFEREIQLAASLQQANIVPLHTAGEMAGVPYYTMPFVEGESLRERLAKGNPLSVTEAVGVLRDVARALSYAHAHGVVHRDIKPDNVLLSHGAAMVTDFGIAKAVSLSRTTGVASTVTQVGMSIGTPAYMSPEQAAGDSDVDHRADLYAFGCMAYEMLAGRQPFAAPTPQRMLAAHITERPRALSEVKPDVPPQLASLVMQCLEKSPVNRPASANDVLRALDAVVTPSSEMAALRTRSFLARRGVLAAGAVLLAAAAVGVFAAGSRARAVGVDARRSIAVLPFANLGGDKTDDYFGEGIAQEITGALGRAGLRVIGRSSAVGLAAKGLSTREIAQHLGVSTVLEGSVQRAGGQVRVAVSLTSAADGTVLWSDQYTRAARDVFAVQDEIARSVATQLRVTLAGAAGAALVRQGNDEPEAHALYLQGLYLWNRRTPGTLRQAVRLFERAIERDPKYATAYAGIALAYTVLPIYDEVPPREMLSKSRGAAERALAIDSTVAEAHTALGYVNTTEFRNAEAALSFGRALAIDSTFATTHFWHALLLSHLGRHDEALREVERARALEPASLVMQGAGPAIHYSARRTVLADSLLREALALDPGFQVTIVWMAMNLVAAGRPDSSAAVIQRIVDVEGLRRSFKQGLLAYALARAGRVDQARAVLAATARTHGGRLPASASIAAALDALGERDRAVAMIGQAVDQPDVFLMLTGNSPLLDGLRADPRARALLERTEAPR